jgi:hypothetical protein
MTVEPPERDSPAGSAQRGLRQARRSQGNSPMNRHPDRGGYFHVQGWMLLTGAVLLGASLWMLGFWTLGHDTCDDACERHAALIGGLFVWATPAFIAVWVALWFIPWWRGLRVLRLVLAVLATAPLVLLPLEMLTT